LFVVDTHHSLTTKEEFEDTKGVIRIRKSKKNRQHNGQKKVFTIKLNVEEKLKAFYINSVMLLHAHKWIVCIFHNL
jgi:hypothetical protein